MKSKIYEFNPAIYPFKLLVTKEFDSKELGDMFYVVNEDKELCESYEVFTPASRTTARTIEVSDKNEHDTYIMVILCHPKNIGVGIISHESLHVSNIVAEWLGFLPEKAMEDEPVAYLSEWVAKCINSVLKGTSNIMQGRLYKEN